MLYGYSLSRSGLPVYLFVLLDILVSLGAAELVATLLPGDEHHNFYYHSLAVIHALLLPGIGAMLGLYRSWRGRSLRLYSIKVALCWWFSFSVLLVILFFIKATDNFSRIWLGSWFATGLFLQLVLRVSIYEVLKFLRRQGRNSRRVLVIGHGRNFKFITEQMKRPNDWGYFLDVCIEYTNLAQAKKLLEAQLARDDKFDECWLCLPLKDSSIIQDVMHQLRNHTMDIRYMPGVRDISLLNHQVTPIAGFYSLDLSCSPMADLNETAKRAEDLILASIILLLISPVMLIVAIAVKLTSDGPVLFMQQRLGVNGHPFNVYKFRSMKVHTEKKGQVTQAVKGDPRLTPIGAFIRRTSLDELPQFFNVLEGSMSIVGPRPHAMAHNEQYMELVDSYMKRHKVKPGITGLAQVHGLRGETETLDKMQKRVEMDLNYINSWSVTLDLKIIFLTAFRGFTHSNAY